MGTDELRLDGVIFDFDGVIVDTEPLHWEAFRRMFSPEGLEITWEHYLDRYLGFDDRDVFRAVYKDAGRDLPDEDLQGMIERKAIVFEALVQERNPRPYAGVIDLIRHLEGDVPLALCSGALKRDVEPILKNLRIAAAFNSSVTAEDVNASKPDPESYILAIERLRLAFPRRELEASRCVAIEDTPAGIEAAAGAGLKVLALCNTYPPDQLSRATRIVESLEGIVRKDLASLSA